ncbi:hypothetical protein CKAH01_00274 [Colletotrichum kahawae]|uniref:Uncharacterized protein n=1 Tax=Colletotrichum kahawae TaxID=34407 RepID=A0AAD9YUK9_COLKA|nr:hypothetical protein CKAH01_00274 [Colletotrichum kahawae]
MEDEDADEERGSSSKNAAASTHEDETTDTSSRAYSNTSESASGREGRNLLAQENDADETIEDSTGLHRPEPSPGNNVGDIEENLSSLSLEPDLAQSHIDGSRGIDTEVSEQELLLKREMDHPSESSRRGSGDSEFKGLISPETGPLKREIPEIPSDATLGSETDTDAGKQKKLPSIPEMDDIEDASIVSTKGSEIGTEDGSRGDQKYRRPFNATSQPATAADMDRSAQAYFDLHKAHLSLKAEWARLRDEVRDVNARFTALTNTVEVLEDDKEKLIREKRLIKYDNDKLKEELRTLRKSAGSSAQASVEGSS